MKSVFFPSFSAEMQSCVLLVIVLLWMQSWETGLSEKVKTSCGCSGWLLVLYDMLMIEGFIFCLRRIQDKHRDSKAVIYTCVTPIRLGQPRPRHHGGQPWIFQLLPSPPPCVGRKPQWGSRPVAVKQTQVEPDLQAWELLLQLQRLGHNRPLPGLWGWTYWDCPETAR